jgi:hypothetical protein
VKVLLRELDELFFPKHLALCLACPMCTEAA